MVILLGDNELPICPLPEPRPLRKESLDRSAEGDDLVARCQSTDREIAVTVQLLELRGT
jgi:hypothetical protein